MDSTIRPPSLGRPEDICGQRERSLEVYTSAKKSMVRALEALEKSHHVYRPDSSRRKAASRRGKETEPGFGLGSGRYIVNNAWLEGISSTVLERDGSNKPTGGEEEAARRLCDYALAESTWRKRS